MAQSVVSLEFLDFVYLSALGLLFVAQYLNAQRISNMEGMLKIWIDKETPEAARILHSDHTPQTDKYLDKFIAGDKLNREELTILKHLLEAEDYEQDKQLAKVMVLRGVDFLLQHSERKPLCSILQHLCK
ncbi:MAG: hypothetical protein NTZ48_00195 [Candidatus Omnitrophica bacterium]|nr:hypothetical protein [Candidatus Omnitrophota bacterium]